MLIMSGAATHPQREYMHVWLPKYKHIYKPTYFDNPQTRFDSHIRYKRISYNTQDPLHYDHKGNVKTGGF